MPWTHKKISEAEIVIQPEKIVGKARPRFNRTSGRTYTPSETEAAETEIAWAWRARHGGKYRDHMGPVELDVSYWRKLSRSNPKKWEGRDDMGLPDCDNVLKLVMDALQGVAYHNDKQVTIASIAKMGRTSAIRQNILRIRVTYIEEKWED